MCTDTRRSLCGTPRISHCRPGPSKLRPYQMRASLMKLNRTWWKTAAFNLRIGAEEDGGAEHSLKGLDQAAILRPALLHAERVQHLGAAVEGDRLALLPNRQSREDTEEPDDPAPTAVRSLDARSPARGIGRCAFRARGRLGAGASPAGRRARRAVRRIRGSGRRRGHLPFPAHAGTRRLHFANTGRDATFGGIHRWFGSQ